MYIKNGKFIIIKDQTIKSNFKMTMTNSTFHSTCKSWYDKNNLRK